MLLKQSLVTMADVSSVHWCKVFHLYGGFYRRYSRTGNFIKVSVRVLKKQRRFYKGYRLKLFKKGSRRRSFVTRTKHSKTLQSGLRFSFNQNSINFIRKKKVFLTKHTFGPITPHIRHKRLRSLFHYTL